MIAGNMVYDVAIGGGYYSIKARRVINGYWNTAEGTGNQKIMNVGILGAEEAICISVGNYTQYTIVNNSEIGIEITSQIATPTITRTVYMQT